MPSQISESDFIRKADDLLKDAENRAKALGEGDTFVKDNLKLVDEAKSLHAEGKDSDAYAKYAEALEKIEAAETSVNSEPLARKLLSIQFVYLAVLLFLAYGTRKWPYFGLWSGLVVHDTQTAWFGALGGVSIGIYGIYDHIRKRDFDPKYCLWYLCKPVIGAIFGWFAYLVVSLGLLSTTGINKISNPQLPFAVSFLAGFSERFTIQLIDKLMGVLLGTPDNKASEKPKNSK
ncbi:MAG: hypothetical protein ABSH25_09010 [Syntrophorhabdales bacterium]